MKNATDSIAVIIVAGGSGARMGARLPKQFLPLDGRPVLMHTVQRFADALPQSRIVVVLPSSHIEYWDKLCRRHGFAVPHIVCTGGANRFESVSNGLRHAGEAELIAVHDGVRPLVSREIIERATEDARTYGAVIPVVRPIDSMRRIDRDGSRATATVYILETPGFAYDRVPVKGIVVSEGASASVGNGDVLNFSNPERRARITVTSRSGHRLDWWIYLETYDPFFLGTWRIVDVKLACNQRVSGVGDGAWTTQLSSGEFGTYGLPEYDDRVTITLGEISDNELTGTLVHSAGDDGAYGNFWGVYAPYSVEAPLDMNPRLRHLLPPGESQWTLDLTTNQMKITQNNVSSTMIFGTEGNNRLFRFLLPSAAGEPGRDSFYDNMWRSSTELFYVMYKVGD